MMYEMFWGVEDEMAAVRGDKRKQKIKGSKEGRKFKEEEDG